MHIKMQGGMILKDSIKRFRAHAGKLAKDIPWTAVPSLRIRTVRYVVRILGTKFYLVRTTRYVFRSEILYENPFRYG